MAYLRDLPLGYWRRFLAKSIFLLELELSRGICLKGKSWQTNNFNGRELGGYQTQNIHSDVK